jgi:hypothetical protein
MMVMVGWLIGVPSLMAAPVTFRLEATVAGPRQGAIATLPPSWTETLGVGDAVTALFSFEPVDAPSAVKRTTVEEPYSFILQFQTRTLTAAHFGIDVKDNDKIDEEQDLSDTLSLGRPSLFVDEAPGTPSGDRPTWAFVIGLIGNSSTIDGADVPAAPVVWESFSDRWLQVDIADPVGSSEYGFVASITRFEVVPEPGSLCLGVLSALALYVAYRSVVT